MKYIKLMLLVLSLIVMTGCEEKEYSLSEDTITFEVNETSPEYTMHVLVNGKDKIECDIVDDSVKYNELGTYTASCEFDESAAEKNQFDITVNIVDTTIPEVEQDDIVLIGTSEPELELVLTHMTITDNYSEELTKELIVDGVDFTTPGIKDVVLRVTDESGNILNYAFQYTIFSYDLPTITSTVSTNNDGAINAGFEIEGMDTHPELTLKDALLEVFKGDTKVDERTTTSDMYHEDFLGLMSNTEYVVKFTITYTVDKTGEEEVVEFSKTTTTDESEIPVVILSDPIIVKNDVTIDYEITDNDFTLESAELILYDEGMFIVDTVNVTDLEGTLTYSDLEFDGHYTVISKVVYDLNDGLLEKEDLKEVSHFQTGYLFADNFTQEDLGDYRKISFEVENPLNVEITHLIVNDEVVNVTKEENLISFIIDEEDMELGNNDYMIHYIVHNKDDEEMYTGLDEIITLVLTPELVYDGLTVNDGETAITKDYFVQVKIHLTNAEYFDFVKINVNGLDKLSDQFTISNGDLVFSTRAPSTYGSFSVDVGSVTYLDEGVEKVIIIDKTTTLFAKFETSVVGIIGTKSEFLNMTSDGIYELVSDIDLTDVSYEDYMSSFSGYLDGKGYTIRNVNITATDPSQNSLGLFTNLTSSSIVKNLNISNVSITANNTYTSLGAGVVVGSLSGSSFDGTIENVNVSNSVINLTDNNAGFSVGGLIGSTSGVTVNNSCAHADITVDSEYLVYAGGLIGNNMEQVKGEKLCSTGSITIDQVSKRVYAGGLLGVIPENSELEYMYSTVDIDFYGSLSDEYTIIGGIGGAMDTAYINVLYYEGSLTNHGAGFEVNIGGLFGASTYSTVDQGYALADINIGINPRVVNAGNIVGKTHRDEYLNIITETTYYGTNDNEYKYATIGDAYGNFIMLDSFTNCNHYTFDISNVIGSEYDLQISGSTFVDDTVTTRNELSRELLFNELWDYDNPTIDGYPTLSFGD